jgi:hypothetical protein
MFTRRKVLAMLAGSAGAAIGCSRKPEPSKSRLDCVRQALAPSDPTLAKAVTDPSAAYGSHWVRVQGGAIDIGIGADGSVWVCGSDDNGLDGARIYKWKGGDNWQSIDGLATRIAVAPDGSPWVVNRPGGIFRRVGNAWDQLPSGAMDIGIGAEGSVWITGTDWHEDGRTISRWNERQRSWGAIDGLATLVSVCSDGRPLVHNYPGGIFLREGNRWVQLPDLSWDVAAGPDGSIWMTKLENINGFGGRIQKWDGRRWNAIDGLGVAIAIDPTGLPWVANMKNEIYRRV